MFSASFKFNLLLERMRVKIIILLYSLFPSMWRKNNNLKIATYFDIYFGNMNMRITYHLFSYFIGTRHYYRSY